MNKIRINVLARELEVKAHELLDKLPELGVTEKKTHSSSIDEDVDRARVGLLFGNAQLGEFEKKTHSSSIDEDVADELRRIFGGAGAPRAEQPSSNGAQASVVDEPAAPATEYEPPAHAAPREPAHSPEAANEAQPAPR